MTPGKTVLLHFDSCVAPEVVRLGYLNFETQLYIPNPLRCFKCNRFGHVSANCKCNVCCTACAVAYTNHDNVEIEVQEMDNIDFTSNLIFGNPIYFIAFLAEVINKALTYKENSDINIFEIISEAAGKRMGLSVNAEQLKSLI